MPPKRKALSEASTNANNSQPRTRAAKAAKTSNTSTASKSTVKATKTPITSAASKSTAKAVKAPNASTVSKSTVKVTKAPNTSTASKSTTKAAKTSKPSTISTTSRSSAKMSSEVVKYCNADTLAEDLPDYTNLQWPNIYDFKDDKNQDMPADGEKMDEYCFRTSDLGFPVSEDGMKICMHLDEEMDKRDQDAKHMYICNDWNGWGMTEVFENLFKDFNRDIFTKTISPYKKYTYIEGFAAYVANSYNDDMNMLQFFGNENGDGVKAVVEFLGVMILTTYDMLKEHNLLIPFGPESKIKNLETVTLLLIEFLLQWGVDLDCQWACEIIRCFDEAEIDLEKSLRKQIKVSKDQIKELRDEYTIKKEASEHANEKDNGNGYTTFANDAKWKPKADKDEDDRKMFYRWDWAAEYKIFKKEHPGGKRYDISKMSRAEKREYLLGAGF